MFCWTQLDENLEQWPHLTELVQCYRSDWIKDDNKYGHYDSSSPVSFQNQIFEGPDTDIETGEIIFTLFFFLKKKLFTNSHLICSGICYIYAEMQLASARQIKAEDATDDDIPSSSGRQFTNSNVTKVALVKHLS